MRIRLFTFGATTIMLAGLILASPGLPVKAAAVAEGTRPWPGAVIPYIADPALVGEGRADCVGPQNSPRWARVCRAMAAWTQATGIRFRLASADEARNGSGLRLLPGSARKLPAAVSVATVGYHPKAYAAFGTGSSYGAILHEFGHVLGLMHEHQRPDRARYLDFSPFILDGLKGHCGTLSERDCTDIRNNFSTLRLSRYQSDYDPCSVMHYLSRQGQRNRAEPRWAKVFTLTKAGQAQNGACARTLADKSDACTRPGQKCQIAPNDARIVRSFHGLKGGR